MYNKGNAPFFYAIILHIYVNYTLSQMSVHAIKEKEERDV